GRREVGSAADEDPEDVRREVPQQDLLHREAHSVIVGGCVRNGRSSSHSWIGSPPAPGAADSSPASARARSQLSTSITIHPAMRSLVSANGPSVTGGRPSPSYRTNVPSGASAWLSTYSPVSRSRFAKSSMYCTWAVTSSGAHLSIGTSFTAAGAPR